jgi:phosphoribosyl 1,2-cyclic phosphate phosphodiesterase
MLVANIKHLDAVLLTHAHRDHTAGLDDVRAFNFKQKINMPVYATADVLDQVRLDFAYAFGPDDYPGLPRFTLFPISEKKFQLDGLEITPLPVLHYKLPVLGFRIGDFSYITDANFIPEKTLERLAGTQTLVINALQREPHISHFNLEEAVKMVDLIKPVHALFTHISHKLGLHSDLEKELSPQIKLAFDGQQVTVNH